MPPEVLHQSGRKIPAICWKEGGADADPPLLPLARSVSRCVAKGRDEPATQPGACCMMAVAAGCGLNDGFPVTGQEHSPKITQVSWGRLTIEGKSESYKDAKLFPGGSREWNWRETGTKHVPGILPADVQELLDHGAKIVVLSRGMAKCLRIPRETLDFLKERQIEAHVLPTKEAAELYNRLAEERPVGGLFHTTC
jgi:hypothetical protein